MLMAVSLERLLERQAGVVTLAQAVAEGLSADTVRRRARDGRWTRLHPSVYLVGGHRLTGEARAGRRGCGPGNEARWCPARRRPIWHGMLERPPRTSSTLTVPPRGPRRARAGVRVRRRDLLPVDGSSAIGGLWLTAAPLTALETAVALPDGSTFLDRALQRHVRFPTSSSTGPTAATSAGTGSSAAGKLTGRRGGPGRLRRRAAAGAPPARRRDRAGGCSGHPFGPWRIDLAFPQQKVAVEVDGWAWHVDAERFRTDRRKQNALVRAGWDPLRFTWHDLDGRPAAVLAEICDTLATAA